MNMSLWCQQFGGWEWTERLNKSMFSCGALKWLHQILNPVGLTMSPISESVSTGLVLFLLLSELSFCHEIFQQLLILKYYKAVFE